MANYYEILGIPKGAGFAEIKSAFRRLAKIYHPDKNPGGKEQFTKILKAYETLSNPNLKSSYDYRLNYNISITQTSSASKTKTTKEWSFDEKELKRRRYYDEHIKKYAKTKEAYQQNSKNKKNYNEFKYILFATPIAVVLFLLIFHLATPSNSLMAQEPVEKMTNEINTSKLKMGDSPYSTFFGRNKYDNISNLELTIKNNTGRELIVCLFNKQKFIRSCYIDKGYFVELSALPKDSLTIKYTMGSNFSYDRELKETKVFGAFQENLEFFESMIPAALNSINELTLHGGLNEGFTRVDEKNFFSKE
ncbi:MAG: J domain-containing protein [Bacteroidota bacterium]